MNEIENDRTRVDRHWRGKYGELLGQIICRIAAGLEKEMKLPPDQARRAAELAIEMMREETQGGGIYISKGHLWAVTEKHRRIYRRFTGANHAQLAREFGLSERQIYDIIRRVGEEEFKRRQGELPGVG